jgi:hypothetical protein
MPRHFGLKSAAADGRSRSTVSSIAVPALTAPSFCFKTPFPIGSTAPKLSTPRLALPLSPASWRGGLDRRSSSSR